ncbi:hypothetical protein V22_38970 [Calycomorphotria hydatis]|uniref:Uncharacterized protein n=1 Tax=Calycomorphotria hydatis TaxID=2528027 RepID=A0A517TE24_9PLAN|nr:hypothetical protein V22_38970 [Calycomorphotria hydatis]
MLSYKDVLVRAWPFASVPQSIRVQLLLTVNMLLSILLSGLLVWQYNRKWSKRFVINVLT